MHIYNQIFKWLVKDHRRQVLIAQLVVQVVIAAWGSGVPTLLHAALTILLAVLATMGKLEERDTMCEGPHPYIPVVNVAKCEMVYEVLGEIVENVLHFSKITPWTVATLLSLGATVKGAWDLYIQPQQSTDAILNKIRLTDLTTQFAAAVEYVDGLPMAGTIGNGVENGAQTVATKLITPGRGRSRRGRIFNVGMPDNTVTNNRITDTYAQDLTDAWNNFRNEVLTGPEEAIQVVVSLCQGKAWLETGEAYAVVDCSTDVWVDSQRRRLHGRGQ